MNAQTNPHEMHIGIAEAGKAAALKGDHPEALRHYREAIRLAVSAKAPEVFFRHYTQCTLESLEITGSYADVIGFCEQADSHYNDRDLCSPLQARDHGSILERLGLVRLKAGDVDGARDALTAARDLAGKGALPLTEAVLGWLARGMSVDARRLSELQNRHNYFIVRKGQVDPGRIRYLPKQKPQHAHPLTQ